MDVDATTELRTDACRVRITLTSPGSVDIEFEGHDTGAFGDLPMRCIEAVLVVDGPTTLTIDARRARGATMDVGDAWARWLSAHRHRFASVRMHVGSAYMRVIADFVRRFAGLESLMRIEVHDPAAPGAGIRR